MALEWYFIRCQSGREDSIARNAVTRIKIAGLQDSVPQVLVPFERVTDLKNGKKRTINQKLYPGYLMVQAVRSQDYPLMQGIFLVITLAVLAANWIVERSLPGTTNGCSRSTLRLAEPRWRRCASMIRSDAMCRSQR